MSNLEYLALYSPRSGQLSPSWWPVHCSNPWRRRSQRRTMGGAHPSQMFSAQGKHQVFIIGTGKTTLILDNSTFFTSETNCLIFAQFIQLILLLLRNKKKTRFITASEIICSTCLLMLGFQKVVD